MIALRIIFSDEETGLGAYPGLVFMRRGAQMKLLLTQRAPRAAGRRKIRKYYIWVLYDSRIFAIIERMFVTEAEAKRVVSA